MPRSAVFAVLMLSVLAVSPAARADTRLGDGCDLSIFGVPNKEGFLRFDQALRSALDKRDAGALALVVQFPLVLNYADGSRVALDNPAALQKQFDDVFRPALRNVVAEQKPGALFCKADGGVMYANGELWADLVGDGKAQHFRVTTVNVPGSAPKPKPAGATVQLACDTDKFHIVIDAGAEGAPRYRSWNKPHAPPDNPALELLGKAGGEGTGSCFHRTWRFRNGNVGYALSEPGCSDGRVPDKARAQLEVNIGNRPPLTSWCY